VKRERQTESNEREEGLVWWCRFGKFPDLWVVEIKIPARIGHAVKVKLGCLGRAGFGVLHDIVLT
jgi:hypothetical protein